MRRNQFSRTCDIFLLLIISGVIYAQDATQTEAERVLEIAREVAARENGYGNYEVDMTMILISASDRRTERHLRVISREIEGDGDQTLAIFESPADVRGTGFLSHTHINRDDDQWLYLPSLKRVKRISPRNKTAPFMGSEFSYEDLTSFEVENFIYRYVGEEVLAGQDCYVLDRFPVYDFSGYSRQRLWVDQQHYRILKVEFYNEREELEKTLVSTDFELYLDQYWYPHKMTMQNHLSGKTSELYWDNFRFRVPLRDADFNPNAMSRIR